jgi:hypothetical protein
LALATLSGCSVAGCSVAGLSERDASIAINQCGQDNSCPDGQVCSNIGCVGTSGTLSTLLFEVSPGVAANNAAGAQFFMREDTIPLVPTATSLGGTFPRQFFSLSLNEVVSVAGSLNAATCSVSLNGSDTIITNAPIPARVTFAPSERMWGLATTTLTVSSAGDDHSFRASLPGGTYDVYVEPLGAAARDSAPSKSCAVLPQLFRAQDLKSSTSLKLSLPAPKRLELQLLFPEGNQNLDGWHLDVVEPVTGRVVSNDVELQSPTHDAGTLAGTLAYSATLEYVPVWGDDPNLTHGEIVRLSPPKKLDAPTLFFWREGLEWASPGSGSIDQFTAYPSTVSFSGHVKDSNGTGVPATVTFTATEIAGVSSGLFPSFIRSAETDADGRFQINLLPGVYKAVAAPLATPNERPFATATTQFTVLSSSPVQAGATLSVQPAFSVQGNVVTPRREGARGALVSAEVSPARVTSTVFDRAIGEVPTLPRSASDIIEDTSGAFQFFAEPGVYDFSVRPPANSGFAWLVIPGLEPAVNAAANNSLDLDLSELHLPPPLPLELHVAWPARPDSAELLTGASVRAYALIDATGAPTTDAKAAASAVRVAEGRIDDAGRVTLMLPAKLDRPPDGFASLSSSQP